MTSFINQDLQVPYEIGCYITSLVPFLEDDHNYAIPRALRVGWLEDGPNPKSEHQMTEGLLLEVFKCDMKPHKIYTRYGEWKILGSSVGSFETIFTLIQE